MPRAPATLTDVGGVRVGQSADPGATTGVTAILFDAAASAVVDVRGGASATYDTASLSLDATFGRRWALFFAGGSLFGLDAARGVRERILEEGGGHSAFRSPHRVVPISGAALFDLPATRSPLPDYRSLGYVAAKSASRSPVAAGRVGAGTGATVDKLRGRRFSSPGGVGSAASRLPGLGRIGVLVAANSVGAIRDPATGRWLSGTSNVQIRGSRGTASATKLRVARRLPAGTNLLAVVTDASVSRGELARIAILAQTGLARSVVPANTATDGDVVFAVSTGTSSPRRPERRPGARADALGGRAADLVAEALRRAIRSD
ncbi:MAG TPA: P1 family peptidase [Thermoplasmata archaeon]